MAPNGQLQIFIQANITVGKKLKTSQKQLHLLSLRFMKLFYKKTTCLSRLLSKHFCLQLFPPKDSVFLLFA